MMYMPQINYVQISQTPSALVAKTLSREPTLEAGGTYLAVGLIGLNDCISLVDSEGYVVVIPYDDESFSLTE